MLRKNNPQAQSTLEYIVAITAIVGLIIYAAANWIKPAVTEYFNDTKTAVERAATKF